MDTWYSFALDTLNINRTRFVPRWRADAPGRQRGAALGRGRGGSAHARPRGGARRGVPRFPPRIFRSCIYVDPLGGPLSAISTPTIAIKPPLMIHLEALAEIYIHVVSLCKIYNYQRLFFCHTSAYFLKTLQNFTMT